MTDRETGAVLVPADYSQLGVLLIVVGVLTVALPLATSPLVKPRACAPATRRIRRPLQRRVAQRPA